MVILSNCCNQVDATVLWIAVSNSCMNFFVFLATYRPFRAHFLRLLGLRNNVSQSDVTFISSS